METYVFLKRAMRKGSLQALFSDAANPKFQELAIAQLGGKVLLQCAVAGSYDFVLIAELPGAAVAGTVSILCNGRGIQTEALRAYSPQETAAGLNAAGVTPYDVEVTPYDAPGEVTPISLSGAPAYVFLKRAMTKGSLEELFSDAANPKVQELAIAGLGGTALLQCAVAGSYDFVLIAELPGAAVAGTVCILCDGRGVHTEALRIYSMEEPSAALASC